MNCFLQTIVYVITTKHFKGISKCIRLFYEEMWKDKNNGIHAYIQFMDIYQLSMYA